LGQQPIKPRKDAASFEGGRAVVAIMGHPSVSPTI
jgi:hypothetical protein